MRAILLALITMAVAPAVSAQTLLESVLYVLSLQEAKDDEQARVTVVESGPTLRSEMAIRGGPNWTVTITRLADCAFEVDHGLGTFSARYTTDFANADVTSAGLRSVANRFGRSLVAVTIPKARYCLTAGRPYLNAIPPGTCADEFSVELAALPRIEDLPKMLAAIRRVKELCRPGG
jgi:hypothetical protein